MRKGHILVVDDEENILSSLEGILTDEGYAITKATDGDLALKEIELVSPDLVLLDIWIPGMDGIQTLKAIKKINPSVEVIMMSGHGTIETAVKATKTGAYDFIEKPVSMEILLSTIESAFNKKRNIPVFGTRDHKSALKIVGASKETQKVRKLARLASNNSRNILIQGVRGSGKSFIATVVYQNSSRKDRPLFKIKCDSLRGENADFILLGGKKKNANEEKREGTLEKANGGTIILDALEMMPLRMRKIFLKIMKEKSFKRKGEKSEIPIDIRFITTSNIDLGEKVQKGEFDQDLYNCLSEMVIEVPSLKKREAINELVSYFIDEFSEEYGRPIKGIEEEALFYLHSFDWKGDLKELKTSIEQMVIAEQYSNITLNTVKAILPRREEISFEISSRRLTDTKSGKCSINSETSEITTDKRKKSLSQNGAKPQCTLKNSVVLCGHGLHSGLKTGLILSPLPAGSGILFGDISSGETIPAHIDFVESTQFSTALKRGTASVKTIEHIMAVLHMYGITNLLIKMGDEVPIMDGSAVDFCQLIEDGQIEEQDSPVEEIVIREKIEIEDGSKKIIIEPADCFSVFYHLNYPYPVGIQEYSFTSADSAEFKKEIAPARTFGFVKDIEKLEEMGLATGGKLSNFILIDDEKVINTQLRFTNEFVRHKILDIIGDFYLLGRPVRARIDAKMTGHSENIKVVRKIRELYTNSL